MRVAQALEIDQIGASACRTLHRNEVIERTDGCLDAVDAFDSIRTYRRHASFAAA